MSSNLVAFRSTDDQPPSQQLLLTLKGHLSAITDLQYSQKGDRILSASQKDGVARIWSWSVDPAGQLVGIRSKPSHILIKLSNPASLQDKKKDAADKNRRRPNRGASARISCDVASWTCDDSKVVTSQCELEKQTGSDILPGSQYIFLWDSHTGDCLLGISNAHSMQCPVVIPHPTDPSIVCSAGADGFAKLWDWSTGKRVSSHLNTLEFGPIDPRDKGKQCGYLDGSFSPDGTTLVLADDSGRVTVFHLCSSQDANGVENTSSTPSWVNEQYFSNDYYDLHYDQNGYCVERGSELPPHLAPRGVRCSHAGTPFSTSVNEAFRGLVGPLPIQENEARWSRQHTRWMSNVMRDLQFPNKGNLIGQFDPQTTILFSDSGEVIMPDIEREVPEPATALQRTRPESPYRMSSNYRWGDAYEETLHDEGNDVDVELDEDDEDFEMNESSRGRTLQESSDSEEEMFDVEEEPSRVSSRQRLRTILGSDMESDSDLAQYMSTNTHPSGPFIADYDIHDFKISDARSWNIQRDWLRRLESNSSYGGRRSYTPQVGDSVVYIPRAHFETIHKFPSLSAPWQSWPEEAVWPVVRCCIRNIRYRFPFKASYSGRNNRM